MDLTEVKKFEQQVRKLKLSEAIRVGAQVQVKGSYTDYAGGYCALGAAARANGYRDAAIVDFVASLPASVPVTAIIHCNDRLGWSFWQIADWLESKGL